MTETKYILVVHRLPYTYRPTRAQIHSRQRNRTGCHVRGAVIKWFTCIAHARGTDENTLYVILRDPER